MNRQAIIGLLVAFALTMGQTGAQASSLFAAADTSVLASQSLLMQQSGANTTTLAVPGAGELFLTLTDLKFPTSFASLDYAVSDAGGAVIPLTDAGTLMTLDLTAPTTLYANVFGTLGVGGGAGLYNLTATFISNSSTVPLPGSVLSLAGGGFLLLLLGLCTDNFSQGRPRLDQHAAVTTSVA
jgi:hypothetical protein